MHRAFRARVATAVALSALGGAAVLVFKSGSRVKQRATAASGAAEWGATFAGSESCGECHADQFASWRRTFHRTMTQDVSPSHPEAVAGDFSGVTYRYNGVEARMHRDAAGRPVMSFAREGHPQTRVDATVVRTVGSRRYQQYLANVGGVLWRLPMAFHIEERRWFHMNGAFLTPDPAPDQPDISSHESHQGDDKPIFGGGAFDRHVTRWNDNCVFCHNVAPNPGLDLSSGAFRTTVAELGIACEACHGPGAAHVDANDGPFRRAAFRLLNLSDSTIVNPSHLSAGRSADLCGRCHGQRMSDHLTPFLTNGDPFVPGEDLALYSAPLWRDTPLAGDRQAFAARFWDDGTPRLTAYEYQGLLQSGCATRGSLTCTGCHGMHDGDPRGQLRPSARGDRACIGCHTALTAPAEQARHTRHDPAGPGGRCVSCHMPRIVYGVLDSHRSHRIEIPEPARAMAMGRPDACTLCHVEKDRSWALLARARLWGGKAPPSTDMLAPLQAVFAGDPVARALAADAIGRAPLPADPSTARRVENARAQVLIEVMADDRYPAVRHLAARALERLAARGDRDAVAQVRAFDATAPLAERRPVLDALRKQWPSDAATAVDADRVAALRRVARTVDIDIGE